MWTCRTAPAHSSEEGLAESGWPRYSLSRIAVGRVVDGLTRMNLEDADAKLSLFQWIGRVVPANRRTPPAAEYCVDP
ncbi:hypothetical protein FHU28_003134 [Micromonospora echinospora]|uniref:Uncharacterized protein n=1 Tax=Micromonospora echinospora TaxID=1877 RepID=A0ABR6MD42_MICEC|nr:hypothetical protein [Micromonospora echinospora]